MDGFFQEQGGTTSQAAQWQTQLSISVFRTHLAKGRIARAVSTGRCHTGFKFLCWGMVLQGLSWSLVKLACDSAELSVAKSGYIGAFGKAPSEKAVGIFVAAALPRRLRITKIDIDICGNGKFSMPRHL